MTRTPLFAWLLFAAVSAVAHAADEPRPAIAAQPDDDAAVVARAADPTAAATAAAVASAAKTPDSTSGVAAPKPAEKPQRAPAAAKAKTAPQATAQTVAKSSAGLTGPVERLEWARVPLSVVLVVDEERLVTLPRVMRLGMPEALQAQIRSQVLGRSAYLTAAMPFPPTRVIAEDPNSGEAILLDISAVPAGKNTPAQRGPLEIVIPATESTAANTDAPAAAPLDPVSCSRFAVKQAYAPRRLATAVEGIHSVSVNRRPLPLLYRGARLEATPIGAWRCGDFYVTTVQLVNLAAIPVELDPRALAGRWVTATFRHARLAPKGDERDTTVVMLTSERPFDASL